MWVTVQLSKDEHQLRRNIPILEVQKIQRVFETVQAQIINLKLRDHEIYGLSGSVDRADGYWRSDDYWRKCSLLDGPYLNK